MRFRDDTRGVTVQIGAVLLFATIVIALATYQATVVPAQNADVEYQHSQQAQNQLTEVRNALLQTAATGTPRPASVTLGTQYPSRVFLLNPPPAAGTLTAGTYEGNSTISVSNVRARDDETAQFLNGTWSASTKYIAYQPDYHEYDGASDLILGATMLSNYYPEEGENGTSVPLTDQLLVDENTITLVALNGSLSTSRVGAASVSATPVSAPYNGVQVTNETAGNVTITVPTKLDAATLANATNLGEQSTVEAVEPASGDRVRVVLEPGTYTLQTAKLGVGSDVTVEGAEYLTLVESDDDSVTVEARDRFNNPVSGVIVNVSDDDRHLFESSSKRTGENGQATLEMSAGESGTATLEILDGDTARERVTVPVAGGGASGASGRVIYSGDAVARDGPDSNSNRGGVEFTVTNEYDQNATIVDVTVEPEDDGIDVLADRQAGNGPEANELYVESDARSSYVDFSNLAFDSGGADGVAIPREIDVDIDGRLNPGNPVVGPGDDARIYLYEFFQDADDATNVDMVGEPVTVTVTYRLTDQSVGESQFTVNPNAPDAGDGGGGDNAQNVAVQQAQITDGEIDVQFRNNNGEGVTFTRARLDSYSEDDPPNGQNSDPIDRVVYQPGQSGPELLEGDPLEGVGGPTISNGGTGGVTLQPQRVTRSGGGSVENADAESGDVVTFTIEFGDESTRQYTVTL